MSLTAGRMGLQQRKNVTPSVRHATVMQEETYNDTKQPTEVQPVMQKQERHDGHVLVPLHQRSPIGRYDVGPFIVIYTLLIFLDHAQLNGPLRLLKTIAFPMALLSHLALVVAQQWRVSVRAKVGYAVSNNPDKWTHCWVRAPSVGGVVDAEICPIRFQDHVAIVNFRDVVFRAALDCTIDPMETLFIKEPALQVKSMEPEFCRLQYPDDLPLDFYKQWQGHVTLTSCSRCQDVYGTNTTQIQLPPFVHLLGQQLLAPFFLFQLLCVVLWCADEYWYYAIFTLFALIMFECTVAYNRLKNLERLRGTLRHAYQVYVYRHGHWMGVQTTELLPGDVVSLSSFQPLKWSHRLSQQPQQERHVPADVLLLQGDVVVDEALLTGESIPQLKGPLDTAVGNNELSNLDTKDSQHKQSVLFGGTVLVSHDNRGSSANSFPKPPDGGVVGFVLRTGFETAQGSLLRTMAHSSTQTMDGIYTRDTFVFVSLLLLCAVASAVSVLLEGWHDDTRNRFRLLLHVIIIITSVVPPELPMELSLAVTNSVADLMKRCNVYCTEPYRIPWAGRVDVCCFDKTGTLTSDEMRLRGVRLPNGDDLVLPSSEEEEETVPWPVMRVMVGCHAVAMGVGKDKDSVMGDPLEKAVLQNTPYKLMRNGVLVPTTPSNSMPQKVTIHHRFAFSSRLKRMTVLLTEGKDEDIWALTKGAPETIKAFLTKESIPPDYDEVYTHHMSLGQRVLAMGYRNLGKKKSVLTLKEEGRDVVEQDLTFAGFLVLDCPLKPDTKSVISELRKSGHDVVMITGDAVLTAAEVARQVGIIHVDKKQTNHVTYELRDRPLNHEKIDGNFEPVLSRFAFAPLSTEINDNDASMDKSISLSKANLKHLREMSSRAEASFCVSGKVLANFAIAAVRHGKRVPGSIDPSIMDEKNVLLHPTAQSLLKELVPIISVFARHAPRQKEAVVAAFNLGGSHTLMCGDGTNDVGALKRAHVGISIISAPELEAKQRKATVAVSKAKAEQKREKRKDAQNKKGKSRKGSNRTRSAILQDSLRQLQEAQEELEFVELGDASVASPFTSRAVSIKCCKDVLLQGRCTLVTMLQIYKILGVNSLVSALVLSKLHMHGVKQGDRQLTILGIVVALLFLFVTRGKPLPTLSPHRPPSSVLSKQAILSIGVQFLVHAACILAATKISLSYVDPWDPSIIPDGSFNPNVLNSCTFLLTVLATINTFVVNYRGKPFMEDLRDNTLMVRSALFCYAVLFGCTLEVFPPLNDLLQLTSLPDTTLVFTEDDGLSDALDGSGIHGFMGAVGFPVAMCFLMVIDTVLAYVAEKSILRFFEG